VVRPSRGFDPKAESGPLAAFTLLLPMAWGGDGRGPGRRDERGTTEAFQASYSRGWLILSGLAGILSGPCLSAMGRQWASDRRIWFTIVGTGLDRPIFGRFGVFSGGMFGLWPVYSRAEGYDFEVLDADRVTANDLTKTQIFVRSIRQVWADDERQAINAFLSRGGSLLVLGDHTDVFGLMGGFNTLLADYGIQFRFDSAYHNRKGWRGCEAAAPDAIASRWDTESPARPSGHRSRSSGGARPLLTARHGHSDLGSRGNVMGSFLGIINTQGRRLGDQVLAAIATVGRGRVVVLGDTSPFQGGLSYSYSRVSARCSTGSPARLASSNAPARTVAASHLSRRSSHSGIAGREKCCHGACGGVVDRIAEPGSSRDLTAAQSRSVRTRRLSTASHLPSVGHFDSRSIRSALSILRFSVVASESSTLPSGSQAISRARVVAFVAPQRPFTPGESTI